MPAASTSPPSHRPSSTTVLGLVAALLLGSLLSVQSQVNGELAGRLGGGASAGVSAALVSFGTGWLVLTTICLAAGPRQGLTDVRAALRSRRLRPWQLAGGAFGAYLVTAQGITVGTIGVALFIVALVAGQSVSGLWIDHVGLGPAGRKPVSALRASGAALAVVAVALSVSDRLGGASALPLAALALVLLPLLAGAFAGGQQALNGHVAVVGGPFPAAWINFTVGTTLLAGAAAVVAVVSPVTGSLPSPIGTHWWLFTGGVCGVVFVSAASLLVRRLGVLLLTLATVCGQVFSALVLDHYVADAPVGPITIGGAALTLVGVAMATLGDSRSRRRAREVAR